MEFRNGKRKWFDKFSQSCDFFYESHKKDSTVDRLPVHSPKKYSFQHLNARSVRNKVNLITQLINDSIFSISAITDTWLTIDDSALASQLTLMVLKYCLPIGLYHIVVLPPKQPKTQRVNEQK